MTRTPRKSAPAAIRLPLIAVLAWAVPGAGHLAIGQRSRGVILLITIALTFWTGVAVGGVKNTVNPHERTLWFLGQVCAGVHPFLAMAWGSGFEVPEDALRSDYIAYGQSEEIAVVYTAIAGMLNLLVILDVLGRAEKMAYAQPHATAAGGGRL